MLQFFKARRCKWTYSIPSLFTGPDFLLVCWFSFASLSFTETSVSKDFRNPHEFRFIFLKKNFFLQSRSTASEWTGPGLLFFWSVGPIFLPTLIRRYFEKPSKALNAAMPQFYSFNLFCVMRSDLFGVSLARPATQSCNHWSYHFSIPIKCVRSHLVHALPIPRVKIIAWEYCKVFSPERNKYAESCGKTVVLMAVKKGKRNFLATED